MWFCLQRKMFAIIIAIIMCLVNNIASGPIEQNQRRITGRSPKYDFGLGKRRYILRTSELSSKRIPHYDFGLGKRSVVNPYSFGLGKRALDSWNYEELLNDPTVENFLNKSPQLFGAQNLNGIDMPLDVDLEDLKTAYEPKRARPYSFGLGKRTQTFE